MSGWIAAALLAAITFALLAFLLRAPRVSWTAIGAALLFGLSGYALQGRPELPGVPRQARTRIAGDPAAAIAARRALAGPDAPVGGSHMIVADALSRHGQYADAAGILLGAVDRQPGDAQAWLALGNALVGHADGALTPAALYAYRRAMVAAPGQPGPPFFLGLALAQSGRFGEARDIWAATIAAAPRDAPWRGEIAERLRRLDLLIAAARAQAEAGDAGAPR